MKNIFAKILLFSLLVSVAHTETTWKTGKYGNNNYLQHRLAIDRTSIITVKGETEKDHDYIYDSHSKLLGKSNGSITKSGVTVSLLSDTKLTNQTSIANARAYKSVKDNTSSSYYIDAECGNDENNGTSPCSAWKTLAKVSASSKKFKAGDTIYFKGGDNFVGTLNLQNINGSTSNPITFTSYGTGQANITNAIKVNCWTNEGSNIWSKSISDNVYQVFKDDVSLKNARSEFMKLNKRGNTNLGSADLINKTGILNAYAHVYSNAWVSYTRKITKYDSSNGQFTLNRALNYAASVGNRFYIVNSLAYMTHQDDWVYDENEHKLYIYSESMPTNINVVTKMAKGVNIKKSHYLNLENLKFSKVNNECMHIDSSSNITVKNNNFNYCYTHAIYTGKYNVPKDSTDINISDNTITNSVSTSILARSENTTIEGNNIFNNGAIENVTYLSRGISYTIASTAKNAVIRKNTITNSAYTAISVNGSDSIIEKNIIHNFCMELSDGGGIYSYNNTHSFEQDGAARTIIRNNFITNDTVRKSLSNISGIYLDDRIHDVTIEYNHINNAKRGILLHNTKNCNINNNTVYNAKDVALGITADANSKYKPAIKDGEISGNRVTNNTFYMEVNNDTYVYKGDYTMGFPISIGTKKGWHNLEVATFENNKIYNPRARRYFKVRSDDHYWYNTNFSTYQTYDWWSSVLNNGAGSVVQNFALDIPNYVTKVIGSELIPNGKFLSGDISNWFKHNIEMTAGSDENFEYANIKMNNSSAGFRTNNGDLNMKPNTKYELSFDIKSMNDVQLILKVADSSPKKGYLMFRPIWSNSGDTWQHYSLVATSNDKVFDNPRLEFWGRDIGEYQITNISLKEVDYNITEDNTISRYYQNSSNVKKTFTLESGSWYDLDGNEYSGTITLKPYSSCILISADKFKN